MIVYEVNLTINNEIFDQYYAWLMPHINDMLRFKGFSTAEIAKQCTVGPHKAQNKTQLTIRYRVTSEEDLENYLNDHAQSMREKAAQLFGDQFSAVRRVFKDLFFIEAKSMDL